MMNKHDIKNRVLTENTAQGILNHLKELQSNQARMKGRWIWELLQNARDAYAGEDNQLIASVDYRKGELVFEHNGRGFTMSEVAHLIYHGSTKQEDENTIGQYGSGFLTTHLLSPVIQISGQLDDGQAFEFPLRRELGSADALRDSMDQAWDSFDTSGSRESADFSTRFKYPITEDAVGAVEEGIRRLKQCAPLVVVFNPQFGRIDISTLEESLSFEVIERTSMEEEWLDKVVVRIGEGGNIVVNEYLLARNDQVSVAVPIGTTNHGFGSLPLEDIPRLFLGFPLIGTETFSFPGVVNSLQFAPTENRDGVYLGQSNNIENQTNQAIIQNACTLHSKLVEFAANSRWSNIYRLVELPPISEQGWLNRDWLNGQLEELVRKFRHAPAVLNRESVITPKDSIVPFAETEGGLEDLWNLLNGFSAFASKLPNLNEAMGWCDAVNSWSHIANQEVSDFDESFDGRKLVSYFEREVNRSDEDYGTLEQLRGSLRDDIDELGWLNDLFRFLKGNGFDSLIRERKIVLDQAGYFDKLPELFRDNNTDNELKEIGDVILNLDIRCHLRDTRLISLGDEPGKGEYSNDDAIRRMTRELQGLCDDDILADKFIQASPRLLAWISINEEWSYLTDFPVFCKSPDDGSYSPLWLGRNLNDDNEMPFAPTKVWPTDLQQYADLFPWQYIVADEFVSEIPQLEDWLTLANRNHVRADVIIRSKQNIEDFSDFLPDQLLEEGEHKSVDEILRTDVAFLTKDRVGVMARVRDSRQRARQFWSFLTEWLVYHDSEGLQIQTAACVCGGEHSYLPAAWLMPVVKKHWVPQGRSVRDRATAKSLAELLRGSGWTPRDLGDTPTIGEFLEAIQVSRFELTRRFVVGDEDSQATLDDTMTNILIATDGDLTYVRDFVEDMKTDDGLPDYLRERRKQRQVVRQNQRLGGLVEGFVRTALESEGFVVRRTGIGSDFEIEYDLIEEEEEVGIELIRNGRTWLVEVKATREESVRMTSRQAETAVERGQQFLLCVVPVRQIETDMVEEDVRANMRFVQNLGPSVKPLCDELNTLNGLRNDVVTANDGDIQLEIHAGRARVRVDEAAWQDGCRLRDLSSALL